MGVVRGRGGVMVWWDGDGDFGGGDCGCAVVVEGLVGVDLVVDPTAPARGLGCLLTGVCLSLSTSISPVLAMSGLAVEVVGENDSRKSSSLLDQSMSSIASSSSPVSLPVHIDGDGDGDGDIATCVLVPASVLPASLRVSVLPVLLPGLRASRAVCKWRESLRTDFGVAYSWVSSSSSSSSM